LGAYVLKDLADFATGIWGVSVQSLTDPSGGVSGEEGGAVMLVDGGCHLTVSGLAQSATKLGRIHASNKSRDKRLCYR
jgi:hypothetical protein